MRLVTQVREADHAGERGLARNFGCKEAEPVFGQMRAHAGNHRLDLVARLGPLEVVHDAVVRTHGREWLDIGVLPRPQEEAVGAEYEVVQRGRTPRMWAMA